MSLEGLLRRERTRSDEVHYIAFFQFEITGRVDDNKGQGIALLGDIVIIFRGKTETLHPGPHELRDLRSLDEVAVALLGVVRDVERELKHPKQGYTFEEG